MTVLTSPDEWPVVREDGDVVKVEIRPGVKQNMRRTEAIARGLWKEKEKPEDKERKRGRDKGGPRLRGDKVSGKQCGCGD